MIFQELTCDRVVEIITDYLEGNMDAHCREEFERHLVVCRGCRAYLEQMRATIHVAGRLQVDDVPTQMMATLLSSFRARAS